LAKAYYYVDPAMPNTLTTLHVSTFDRANGRWTHAGDLGRRADGAAIGIQPNGPYLFVRLHWGPAASGTFVLDRDTLQRVALLEGWDAQPVPDGTFVFVGNMPGAAPFYQEPLWTFDPAAGRQFAVLVPGGVNPITDAYRASIVDAPLALPDPVRREYETVGQGFVDDFSRSIEALRIRSDGQRLAFVAEYSFDRFPRGYDHPGLATIVRCDRESRARWTCEEREADPVARAAGRMLGRRGRGGLDEEARAWLVDGALAR
jgi:hypothetical protein